MQQLLQTVTYRGFILCVVNPRYGSTTNIVAKSSNSARALKFMSWFQSSENDTKHTVKRSQKTDKINSVVSIYLDVKLRN